MRHYFLQDLCNSTPTTTTQTQTDTDMTSWISRGCSKLQKCLSKLSLTSPRTDENNITESASTATITNTSATFVDDFYEITEQNLPGYENLKRKGKVVIVRSISSCVENLRDEKIEQKPIFRCVEI